MCANVIYLWEYFCAKNFIDSFCRVQRPVQTCLKMKMISSLILLIKTIDNDVDTCCWSPVVFPNQYFSVSDQVVPGGPVRGPLWLEFARCTCLHGFSPTTRVSSHSPKTYKWGDKIFDIWKYDCQCVRYKIVYRITTSILSVKVTNM